jgi:peptidoglycan/LPS O-acetylase OafA/YrhL
MSVSLEPKSATASSPGTGRYHSLDALRAFAMLLGIFLHVAWFFLPYESGTPMMDIAVNEPCNYIFYVTHIFRMQVFYLLAGFFARLLLLRIGYVGFAWHRFSRIAVPFVVGWLIMYPLFTLYWVWGGIQSGRILTEEPFWSFLASRILADELSWFSLTHLWFLYYLLLIYGMAIGTELLLKYLLDRRGRVRQAIGDVFHWQMNSRLNVLWLSVPLWPCLWWMGDWFGITTPSDSLVPNVPVLAAYAYFFFVGWLLHGQLHLLYQFEQRWQLNLLCGIAISVPLYMFFTQGISNGTITWAYPLVFGNEIRDYSAIRAVIRETDESEAGRSLAVVRDALSPSWRRFVEETSAPSIEQASGLATDITARLILSPAAFQATGEQDRKAIERLKAEAARRGNPAITIDAHSGNTPLQNRWLLEAALPPGTFSENIVNQSWYQIAFGVFSAGYALSTWLLIFGSMGLFMRCFADPSPLVRYIADSSYWLYIVHLPILCQINVLVAGYRWHWLPKSVFYTLVTFAIMMPSYHYLVRSTWLGKALNGRAYPFRPWFR